MIRPATAEDFNTLLELGRAMHAESWYRYLPFDDVKLHGVFEKLITDGYLRIHVAPNGSIDGGMAGYIGEFWFCTEKIASDYALFVRPNHRGSFTAVRLIQDFIEWAKERGAQEVSLAQSTGVMVEQTSRLYLGMGFAYVGGIYKWRLE
jgi:GNAT superfamily N-acetyltransferase